MDVLHYYTASHLKGTEIGTDMLDQKLSSCLFPRIQFLLYI